jgi:hypothetical protein
MTVLLFMQNLVGKLYALRQNIFDGRVERAAKAQEQKAAQIIQAHWKVCAGPPHISNQSMYYILIHHHAAAPCNNLQFNSVFAAVPALQRLHQRRSGAAFICASKLYLSFLRHLMRWPTCGGLCCAFAGVQGA